MTGRMTEIARASDLRATDAALVGAARGGDRDAFAELLARHEVLVKALVFAITGDLAEKEEIAQEAFLAAWRQLPGLRSPERFRSWICGIAQNLARKWQRDEWFRFGRRSGALHPGAHASADPSPLEQAISREEELALRRALTAIPEPYRLPLVLFYVEQRSVEDIADVLGISEQNAKTRLWRGRRMLQAGLLETTLPRVQFRRKAFAAAVAAAMASGVQGQAWATPAHRPLLSRPAAWTTIPVLLGSVVYLSVVGRRPARPGDVATAESFQGAKSSRAVPVLTDPGPGLAAQPVPPAGGSDGHVILSYDFEDGLLPGEFEQGHVVPSPPGATGTSSVMGSIRPSWPRTHMVMIKKPDDSPLFTYSARAVLAFDYWVGESTDLVDGFAIVLWCEERKLKPDFYPKEYVRETWGHLEVPLSAFFKGGGLPGGAPRRYLEENDSIQWLAFQGGRAGGKPLYVDNIRLMVR